MTRTIEMLVAALAIATSAFAQTSTSAQGATADRQVKYVKFEAHGNPAWGILENETTDPGDRPARRGNHDQADRPRIKVADVKFLAPAKRRR